MVVLCRMLVGMVGSLALVGVAGTQAFAAASASATVQTTPSAALAAPASEGVRAQLVAIRQAVVASELAGKVSALPLREGQRFRQGDTLVSFDCTLHKARQDRATQAELAARKKMEVAEQLDKLASISKADVEQARAAVAVAQAESGVERAMSRRCVVSAPFSGRVGETYVRAAEHVAEGKELMSIYDDSAFEVQTIVPSRWLQWLKPGYPMQVGVEETGQTYTATVIRIAGTVDPVSQSVKVIGRLVNERGSRDNGALLPGMSGVVRISPPAAVSPRSASKP
ncbi:efflux RND transporter periplasmic adaptor subunit [Curvibacter sp. CHRR-16]|uniref:efflux RND transporter periplasmic adaptor subunit n=1 Tax=Curvibacter sp. CHRR-16 TaxID=2835872 RepID=UPI001BD920D7|nr:efflux RND transporter periplasmic adaptor subunit [Curvibacter sp. CHRR-16]MBT0570724.1 efflux RND transporter periplasmic adaptor subunit [Curvibacter sp. CHRR-16]